MRRGLELVCVLFVACSPAPGTNTAGPGPVDGGSSLSSADASLPVSGIADGSTASTEDGGANSPVAEAGVDAGGACSVDGEPGQCITTAACAALDAGYESTPGYCPGAADVQCCRLVPDVADNPPVPAGWQLMPQSAVTPDMTTWAVMILNDPTDYPMFATATQTFGALLVLARVEWHPPDFQNSVVHRGVTLYEPIPDAG